MWRRLGHYRTRWLRYNSTSTRLPYLQRTKKFFDDNPYFMVSLGFVGVVLVFGFFVDSITRKKKYVADLFQCLPPTPCHPIISLYPPLLSRRHVLLTGPEGSGKTTLALQTGREFLLQRPMWSRRQPRVFYINATTHSSFITTLRECLLSYGLTDVDIVPPGKLFHYLQHDEQLQLMLNTLRDKLTSSKCQWLIVVDDISMETMESFRILVPYMTGGRLVGVASNPELLPALKQSIPSADHVILEKLPDDKGLQLMAELSSTPITEQDDVVARQLVDMLDRNPLAISCAAVTMATMTGGDRYNRFMKLLQEQEGNMFDLYSKHAVDSDGKLRHVFDLVSSLHSSYPIPVPVIVRHLQHSEYHVEVATPTTLAYQINPGDVVPWWQRIGQIFQPVTLPVGEPPIGLNCPLLSYQDNKRTGVCLLYHSNQLHKDPIQQFYLKHTVPLLEGGALQVAKSQSQQSWFSGWRGFNKEEALSRYRRQLPGIGSSLEQGNSGAMTTGQYPRDHMITYHSYQQLLAHHHRLLDSVTDTVRSDVAGYVTTSSDATGDKELVQLAVLAYMMPHLSHLLTVDHISPCDQVRCTQLLGLGHMIVRHTPYTALGLYEQAASKWEGLNGKTHPLVAHVITEMANVYNSVEEADKCHELLERAADIYNGNKAQLTNKQLLDYAECLSALAMSCGNHGDKKRARQLVEEALVMYEQVTVATSGKISDHHKSQIASLMTDLAHVLIYLGELPRAKKYLDMADAAHRNLHGNTHAELARCLNLQSVLFSLHGDRNESRRVREEAGIIQNKLQVIPSM